MAAYTLDAEFSPDEDRGAAFNRALGQRQQRHGRVVQSGSNLLRARGQLIQEEVAQERFDMQHQELDLKRVTALANIFKQRAIIQKQMQAQQHTVGALAEIGKLDGTSPDYHLKLAEVFRNNPMASNDPVVQRIVTGQIQDRHTFQQSDAIVRQHEESQASEFARIHGVNPVRFADGTPTAGRIDWRASQDASDAARKDRQQLALTGVDPTLKPTEITVDSDGKVKQTFKAQPDKSIIPSAVLTKQAGLKADIAGYKAKADRTQAYIDAETNNLKNQTTDANKKVYQDKIDALKSSQQEWTDKANSAQVKHDTLMEQFKPVAQAGTDAPMQGPTASPTGASLDVPKVASPGDFHALASGSRFLDPNGEIRIKP